jgi:hypothetical protein
MFRAGRFLVSFCLLAVATAGIAEAKSNTGTGAVAVKVATSEPVSESVAEPAAIAAPVASMGAAPACARRVKVVYQGYGEADRAGCAPSAVQATR